MWFIMNNIDSHSIEWELIMLKTLGAETVQYGLKIIFNKIAENYVMAIFYSSLCCPSYNNHSYIPDLVVSLRARHWL